MELSKEGVERIAEAVRLGEGVLTYEDAQAILDIVEEAQKRYLREVYRAIDEGDADTIGYKFLRGFAKGILKAVIGDEV